MTIRKGEAWGAPGALPADGVVVRSDAEARHVVEAARRAGRPVPPLGLLGGDLCRTLGGVGDEARLHSPSATTLLCDLGSVLLDGRLHWFVASLCAPAFVRRRAFWAMNAAWAGERNVAPKAHPGDGLLDMIEVRASWWESFAVRSRMRHGDHLPHPGITVVRAPALQVDLGGPTRVLLDGEVIGRFRNLGVRVEADALTVVV